jgi:hypothetical protein
MSYECKYFSLKELLPEVTYRELESRGRLNFGWYLFDQRILMAADLLRGQYGPMLCNTWATGGEFGYRGYRPPTARVGSVYSQHRFGRALDLWPLEVSSDEIRRDIKLQMANASQYITGIEDGVSWLHIDCRNWDKVKSGLYVFKP